MRSNTYWRAVEANEDTSGIDAAESAIPTGARMKAGYLLLIAGFLVAAYSTALDTQATQWTLFVPAALAGVAGMLLLKRHAHGTSRTEAVLTANRTDLEESLNNIVRALDELAAAGDIPLDRLREEIDRRLRDDLRRFADARESMVHLFGLQAYADIMSDFAAGERYVNRVWSASADGYDEESRRYLRRALKRFLGARDRFRGSAGESA
jgi:hypothetical protein